ncbi:MAG TPA: LysE family translocator [Steroidobacteraceae bacterium]|nr:LysE family translocator [Steroidobacteraceae bacterium]
MIDPQVLAFTFVAALMTMSPGPDTMLVVRNALRGGRRDGLLTVAGICSGLFVHALLSALGVSAVLMYSANAFAAMKVAGACYLVWLGIKSLRAAAQPAPAAADGGAGTAPVAASQSFREGLLTNVLNPKVVVFYLALVPQFIGPGDAVMLRYLLLTAIHYVEGVLWLGGVALLVAGSRGMFLRPAWRRWTDAACGTILVALGLRLALQRQ